MKLLFAMALAAVASLGTAVSAWASTAPPALQTTGHTAYLVNGASVKIGTLYEECSSTKTTELVQLSPGIYLKSGQSLVLVLKGTHTKVFSYTATSNQEVGNFQGTSARGCIAPGTALQLDTVSAATWTVDAHSVWLD